MEFNEKLQELRKSRGLTQEELADALFVSRTAVSKWESGRGYPSIDSLKDISRFFLVSIDDLLSGDKLISIAEKENKSNISNICNLILGVVDLFFVLLILLPIYPNGIDGHVQSVCLSEYVRISLALRIVYLVMFLLSVSVGLIKIILTKIRSEESGTILTAISMGLNIITVLILASTREAYAVTVAFLILIIKGIVILKKSTR